LVSNFACGSSGAVVGIRFPGSCPPPAVLQQRLAAHKGNGTAVRSGKHSSGDEKTLKTLVSLL
jgi:hypothetical protein